MIEGQGVLQIDMLVADKEQSKQRKVLHVRSISKWAPACIGPYSQVCFMEDGSVAFLAGMIGLDPSSMTLIQGKDHRETVTLQFLCSLLYVERVLAAIRFGSQSEPDPSDEIRDPLFIQGLETFPSSFDSSHLLHLTIYTRETSTKPLVQELCDAVFGQPGSNRV